MARIVNKEKSSWISEEYNKLRSNRGESSLSPGSSRRELTIHENIFGSILMYRKSCVSVIYCFSSVAASYREERIGLTLNLSISESCSLLQ